MPQVFNIPKLLHGRNGIRIRVALIAVAAAMMGLTAALLARRGAAGAMVGFAVPFALIGLYLLLTRKDWLLLMLLGTRTLLDPLLTIAKGSLGGMGPGAAVNAALLAAGSLLLLRDPHRMLRAPAFLWLPFLGIAGVALALAPDRVMAVRTYMVLLTYFVAFVIPFAVIKQRRDIKHWIWLILAASIVPTIGGFYGIATGGVQTVAAEMEEALELGELELEDPDQFRIQSVFPHPNIYAFFQVTVITTMLYALQARLLPQGRRWQAAGWLYLGVQLVMLLATQTRGAWAACGVIMLVYGLLVDRRMLIYMALACASLLLVPSVQDRLMDLKQGGVDAVGPLNSFAWRQVLWRSAGPWIDDKWAVGWGLDTFIQYSPLFFPLDALRGYDAHNVFVQFAFEMGVPGAVAFVAIFVGLVVIGMTMLRTYRLEAALLIGHSTGYLLSCVSDNMHRYLVANWYTFLLFGVFCSVAYVTRQGRNREEGTLA